MLLGVEKSNIISNNCEGKYQKHVQRQFYDHLFFFKNVYFTSFTRFTLIVIFTDYPTIDQWQMMSVREKDTSFVDTFLTAAVGILRTKDCKDTAADRTSFSIVPKKVKIVSSL